MKVLLTMFHEIFRFAFCILTFWRHIWCTFVCFMGHDHFINVMSSFSTSIEHSAGVSTYVLWCKLVTQCVTLTVWKTVVTLDRILRPLVPHTQRLIPFQGPFQNIAWWASDCVKKLAKHLISDFSEKLGYYGQYLMIGCHGTTQT